MLSDKPLKIPVPEVWKRRLFLFSVFNVILTLVGLVMVSVECTKLQINVFKLEIYIGFSQALLGLVSLYVIFGYTVYRHSQYPTGPVLISSHALFFLIGLALITVAYIVPADDMFHFLKSEPVNANLGETGVEGSSVIEGPFTEDLQQRHDLVKIIQMRLTILGGGISGIGILGGLIPLFIIYRVYISIEIRKEQERERRKRMQVKDKKLYPNETLKKIFKRDSVYDYAGWGNRTGDIYSKPFTDEDRDSVTPSILSAGMMAGMIGDSSPEPDSGKLQSMYQKTLQNTERRANSESGSSAHKKGSSEKIFTGKRLATRYGKFSSVSLIETRPSHYDSLHDQEFKRKTESTPGSIERRNTSPVVFNEITDSPRAKRKEPSYKRKLKTIRQESKSAGEITCSEEIVQMDKLKKLERARTDICLQKSAE